MDLKQENAQLKERIGQLESELRVAQQRIQELLALLNQDSHNSHWPSSRDKGQHRKRTHSQRRANGKTPGGQTGHTGKTLEMQAHPDTVVVHRPETCPHCQTAFSAAQAAVAVTKRQVHDLPPFRLLVTEHQAETLRCAACGQLSQGAFPESVVAPVQYGPGVQQLAVYLRTAQYLPYERSQQLFADLFDLHLSPGTLETIIQRAARRVQPLIPQLKTALRASPVVHCDESGFYIQGTRQWLHTASTATLTYYYPHARRGHAATEAMDILPHFRGTAVHDNWSAYRQYQTCRHALCNVHHLRELTAVAENDHQPWAARFTTFLLSAKQAVAQARAAGHAALPPQKLAQIERLYARLTERALHANAPPPQGWPQGQRGRAKKPKARNLAERFVAYRQQVLAFVYDFKVPFDNNLVERDLRMLKVQQKISGCFRSPAAAADFCTLRSYLSTMRKQGFSVWAALGSLFLGDVLLPDFTPV